MKERKISEAIIRRLPRYLRHVTMLALRNEERTSSGALAAQLDLNASQVRQDFNCFGGFGQQGYGYNVKVLRHELARIMGMLSWYKMVIVGAGNIGTALANYEGFDLARVEVCAIFDHKPELVGKTINNKPIFHVDQLGDYIRENKIDIGVLANRRTSAQEVTDIMVEAGIRGIWNFVPLDIVAPVPVENIHMLESMMVLIYKIHQNQLDEDEEAEEKENEED